MQVMLTGEGKQENPINDKNGPKDCHFPKLSVRTQFPLVSARTISGG